MTDKIYIARHGFRLNWITSTWKSVTGLPRDPPLAAFGETQAKELGDYFASLPEDEKPTAIFSSPYYRCLQTATPVSRALNLPIHVEHGLSEWYSPVAPGTGLHPRPGSAASLQSFFPTIDPSWSSIWYPSREGEDVAGVHDRVDGFLNTFLPEVERRLGREKSARVLLVSHAATIIALARGLVGDRDLALRVGCCTLSEFAPRAGAQGVVGAWEAKVLADGTHLTGGASREWGFEDIEVDKGRVVEDPGEPLAQCELHGPVGSQVQMSSKF